MLTVSQPDDDDDDGGDGDNDIDPVNKDAHCE